MKETKIHKSAIIDKNTIIGKGVIVGPNTIITNKVKIGDGTIIGANVIIEGNTIIGKNCKIFTGAIIGNPPQDLKYQNEDTKVSIGNNTIIREYVTINRGTKASGETKIGDDCLLMTNVHIAHDCIIGNKVILANVVALAGHVEIEEGAIVGGLTPVHQFVRIGRYSIIGGGARVPQDIPPYCKATDSPAKLYGLNTIGLQRNNFSDEAIAELKKAYKIIFRSKDLFSTAIKKVEELENKSKEVKIFLDFIKNSKRGVPRN
ncbi:MAG: acyl-ACP--UDP-N-acetylglucosamine O-acyltransferase [Elusimicrobiota bacterium]|nr:acyl-ACP--UDP-N-acetylglucosamine O-acyltransferase [Elusimicrobiota bacterium]